MKTFINLLTWLTGIMFILTGLAKLAGVDSMSAGIFNRAGYGSWLFYTVAVFELGGGILLLMKRYRRVGALLITIIMLGAISTHIMLQDNVVHMMAPLLFIAIVVYSVWRDRKG